MSSPSLPRPSVAFRLPRPLWRSVRGRLTVLVMAVTLPALLLALVLSWQGYRNERASVATNFTATARALCAVVDRQIAEYETLARGLALAPIFEATDFTELDRRSRALVDGRDRWIVVTDAEGQQQVNTRVAPGTPLPKSELDPGFWAAMRAGRTYVSDLTLSAISRLPIIYVAVPVRRDGVLKYTVSVAVMPAAFNRGIDVARIAPGTVLSILDRQGRIAARSRSPERFVGRAATPDIVAAVAASREGALESVTLEGIPVYTAFSRSSDWGWSVIIGAPRTELFAGARQLLWIAVALSASLLAIAGWLASSIGRAVVQSVERLAADAELLGRGQLPPSTSSGLAETDFVGDAMRRHTARLMERDRENAKLAAVVESSDDAIISANLQGNIESWNRGAARMFGYPADEVIGRSIGVVIPPDRRHEQAEVFQQIAAGRGIEHYETVRLHKDGRTVRVALSVSPIRDFEGRVVGASAIARDITSRKQAELQQNAIHELVSAVNRADSLATIYAAAFDAVARGLETERAAILLRGEAGPMRIVAARGISAAFQGAAAGHSPWAPADPAPQPHVIADTGHPDVNPAFRQALQAEAIGALVFVPLIYEKRLLGKLMLYFPQPRTFTAGELRPIETIASQVAFAIHRQQSATALEALVEERTASLRQAIAQMEEFSYSVSHDLRSPLRAMSAYADALVQDHGGRLDAAGRDMLLRIVRNGERMDRLIRDLLTYSQLSQREIKLAPVSLGKLVRDVVQQYAELQPQRATIEVHGDLPDVIGHEPSLGQAVSNLLTNAVKFVPAGTRPHVTIRAESHGPSARVWFEDNGIGINPQYQARLFALFERLPTEQKYEGTGIGLAIVRKALSRMNGRVGVESGGPPGSRFWFELPLASPGA